MPAIILGLPDELKFKVFGYLNRADLKSLKLVCRAIMAQVAPSMSGTLYLEYSDKVLGSAKKLIDFEKTYSSSAYGRLGRTIQIDPLIYQPLRLPGFKRLSCARGIDNRRCPEYLAHSSRAHANYNEDQEAMDKTVRSHELPIQLHRALETFPNVRRVVVGTYNRPAPPLTRLQMVSLLSMA